MTTIHINEIFYSLQGEGTRAGLPCVFVRFQGCNLHCKWCDTLYARNIDDSVKEMTEEEIVEEVKKYGCDFIEFTGGEPMLSMDLPRLMQYFINEEYTVALETNGSICLAGLDKRIIKIVDVKCPGSGCLGSFNKDNLRYIRPEDEVKFVVSSIRDLDYAYNFIKKYSLFTLTPNIIVSPVTNLLQPTDVATYILREKLPVKMQLQLHKIVWGADTKGK